MGFGRLVGYSFCVLLAGFLQHWPVFSIYGIRPNFTLVILIVLSFLFDQFIPYIWLVLLGLFTLKFQAGFDGGLLGVGLISISAYWLSREMPWKRIYNNSVLIVAGTIVSYVLAKPSFLSGFWLVVVGEIIYNLIIGSLLFLVFSSDERRSEF